MNPSLFCGPHYTAMHSSHVLQNSVKINWSAKMWLSVAWHFIPHLYEDSRFRLIVRNTSTKKHGLISRKAAHYMVTGVRASNLTSLTEVWTNFPKTGSHLEIPGAIRATWRKFHTEDPQIIGGIVQNLVAMATWSPLFRHPWTKFSYSRCVTPTTLFTKRLTSKVCEATSSSFGKREILESKK
jgi:hypothetical protein